MVVLFGEIIAYWTSVSPRNFQTYVTDYFHNNYPLSILFSILQKSIYFYIFGTTLNALCWGVMI